MRKWIFILIYLILKWWFLCFCSSNNEISIKQERLFFLKKYKKKKTTKNKDNFLLVWNKGKFSSHQKKSNTIIFLFNFFDFVAGVLQEDTLTVYLFIICLAYVLRTSRDQTKGNGLTIKKKRSRRYPAETIIDTDYANDLALLVNTPTQAESLWYNLEQTAGDIGPNVNGNKTESMYFKQEGAISTLWGKPLKLIDHLT